MNGITDKIAERLILLSENKTDEFFAGSKTYEHVVIQELGEIDFPTGKIVACDPLVEPEAPPFNKQVEPGKYPVTLYIHCIGSGDGMDKRVAFAKLSFSDKLPSRFELAVSDGQEPRELEEGEFFGYGVDSGTGCFMDGKTAEKLVELIDNSEDYTVPELDAMLEDSYVDTYCTANFTLPETELNLAAFSSGFGDGVYPTYWGYDDSDNICCLITDFETVDYNLE